MKHAEELDLIVGLGCLGCRLVRVPVLFLVLMVGSLAWPAAASTLQLEPCLESYSTNTTRLVAASTSDYAWSSTQGPGNTPPITWGQSEDPVLGPALLVTNANKFASLASAVLCDEGGSLGLTNLFDMIELKFDFRFLNNNTPHDFRFGLYSSGNTNRDGGYFARIGQGGSPELAGVYRENGGAPELLNRTVFVNKSTANDPYRISTTASNNASLSLVKIRSGLSMTAKVNGTIVAIGLDTNSITLPICMVAFGIGETNSTEEPVTYAISGLQVQVTTGCRAPVPDLTKAVLAKASTDCESGELKIQQDPPAGTLTGSTNITFTVWDECNHTNQCTTAFVVQDNTPPLITFTGNPLRPECHEGYLDPTAEDACDGVVSQSLKPVSGTIDSNSPGLYPLIYQAIDAATNVTRITLKVRVVDTQKPVPDTLPYLPTRPGTCFLDLTKVPPPTATDKCSGKIIGKTVDLLTFGVGTHSILWYYEDGNGNVEYQTQAVEVRAGITPSISPNGAVGICPGGSVTLRASPDGATYSWSDGRTGQSITVTSPGTYTVTVTDNNGCSGTSDPTVVKLSGAVSAGISPSGTVGICSGGSVTLTASPAGASYLWSDGSTGPSITVNKPGPYTVTVTDNSGCNGTSQPTTVTVSGGVSASISPSGIVGICSGRSVTLTASPAGASYLWSDGSTGPSITVDKPGPYTVTVTDNSGCKGTSQPTTVTAAAGVAASISPSGTVGICPGGSVTLKASPDGATYLWSDGRTGQSITVNGPGTYTVTVTDSSGCKGTSEPATVTQSGTGLSASISPSGTVGICPGGNVRLTASPAGVSYLWSDGSTGQSIMASSPGPYTVTVTDSNGCQGTSQPTTVTVSDGLTRIIPLPEQVTYCWGHDATLSTKVSGATSFTWKRGSVSVDLLGARFRVTTAGDASTLTISGVTSDDALFQYSVTASGNCLAHDDQTAFLSQVPELTISPFVKPDLTACTGPLGLAQFDVFAGVDSTNYVWKHGTQILSTSLKYRIQSGKRQSTLLITDMVPSDAGVYSVEVSAACGAPKTNYGTLTVIAPITITNAPIAQTSCAGGTVSFSVGASGNQLRYQWTKDGKPLSGATDSTLVLANVQASDAGTYGVTVTNTCFADAANARLTVSDRLSAMITPSGTVGICSGGNVTLMASPAGASYLWSDGSTGPSITVNKPGPYTVTVTDNSGCKGTSDPTTVTIAGSISAGISPSGTVGMCPGGSVTLTASPGAASYLWSDGSTGPSITVNKPGPYTVTVTDNSGCKGTSQPTTVTLSGGVSASISPSGTVGICPGGSVTLTASPAGASYLWSDGSTGPSITVNKPGPYTVTVTDNSGCKGTSQPTTVTLSGGVSASISASGTVGICPGGSVTLTASPAGASYLWSDGSTGPSITVNKPGPYTVTVTDNSGCKGTSQPTTVTVSGAIAASISPSGTVGICAGANVRLTASPAGASYVWSDGSTGPSITVNKPGPYTVTVTDSSGCKGTSEPTTVALSGTPTVIEVGLRNQAVCLGETAQLTVTAGGAGPFEFTWLRNGTVLQTGGKYLIETKDGTSTLTINNISETETGTYAVQVTGGCANAVQQSAELHLGTHANASPLSAQVVCAGQIATFTTSVLTGTGPFSFVWTRENQFVANGGRFIITTNETSSSLAILNVSEADEGIYAVKVAGSCGDPATQSASLSLLRSVSVTMPPQGGPVCLGTDVTLSVEATGTDLRYQWRKEGQAIPNATDPTLLLPNISEAYLGSYDVEITSGCDRITSTPAVLTVNSAALITTQPISQTVCVGADVTFTVRATGTDLKYQWRKDGVPIPGATSSDLVVTNVQAGGDGDYDVVVSSGCRPANSQAASLRLTVPVVITTPPVSQAVCAKDSVTLTVGATGTNLSYQWRRNGENLPSATASSLFLSNVTSSDAGSYDVVVNSSCGFVISSPAKVDVHAPPVVTLNTVTTCPGTPVVLTAAHDAGPDATFFWLPGEATTPTLTVSPLTTTGYLVRVTSAGGCSTEASTVVTVFDSTPPTVVQCPPDRILNAVNCQTALPDLTKELVASDDCTSSNLLQVSQSPVPGAIVGLGETVITLRVQDQAANFVTCLSKVTVVDPLPEISIQDVAIVEGDNGTTNAVFKLSLSKPTCTPVGVQYATAETTQGGSTTNAVASPKIVFAGKQIVITWPKTWEGYQLQAKETVDGDGTWQAVGQQPAVQNDDYVVAQPTTGNSAFYRLWRPGTTGGGPSAKAGEDFVPATATITFEPGQTEATITVAVMGDVWNEADETFLVNLSNPSNAVLARDHAVGTILNDDAVPVLNIDDDTVTRIDTSTTNAVFTVRLATASGQTVSVAYSTVDGTAKAPQDYLVASGVLTFNPGETSKSLAVQVNAGTGFQLDRTFAVNLSGAVNATLGKAQGTGTIHTATGAPVLSVEDVALAEGNAGSTPFVFNVRLAGATIEPVTVRYATADRTAKASSDYQSLSGSLTFNPGETNKTITVLVEGNTLKQSDRTFTLQLSEPINASLGKAQAVGTIQDDDAVPVLSISDTSVTEGNTGTTPAVFTVSLTGPTSQTVTVDYATADGVAKAGGDYESLSGTLTFLPGELSKPIRVLVTGDTLYETDESFSVILSRPVNATLATSRAMATIRNDDPAPVASISDAQVLEGDRGTTAAVFTVRLSADIGRSVSLNYATADDSAKAGSDYQPVSGSLSFVPGETTKTITVLVNGDTLYEPDETFLVNLSGEVGVTLGNAQGFGTIKNDDAAPVLSISDATVSEGNSGTTATVFTVSLSGSTTLPVTVSYATADGSGKGGTDYQVSNGLLTFNPGETSKTITVQVVGNTLKQTDRTFLVNLSNPGQATLGKGQGTGTIRDDDDAPVLSITDVTVTEGNSGTTPAVFTVSLSGRTTLPVTVSYATADGSGKAGTDYQSSSSSLTFNPGETSKTITVQVVGNALKQTDRTFLVTLSNPVQATLGKAQGTGTIRDDDAAPVLSISDVSVVEGNSGTAPALFTVSLSGGTTLPVTVSYATADGSGKAGTDYQTASGSLTFNPGETSKTVTVQVVGNTLKQTDRTFVVNLSNPGQATLGKAQGAGTIRDDDAAPVLSIGDVSVAEGNSGTTPAVFTIRLSAGSGQAVSVNYATADDSAKAGSDYVAASGSLTFAPGETSKTITVLVNGDTLFESDETFLVNLSGATGAAIGTGQGFGTIQNDDSAPALSINDVTVVEGNSGTSAAVFMVSLSAASGRPVSVSYATADGTARAGLDYVATSGSLTFAPAGTGGGATVTPVISRSVTQVTVSWPAYLEGYQLQVTRDLASTWQNVTNTPVVMGDLRVVVIPASGALLEFYRLVSSVVFAPGETTKTITVLVNGDSLFESDETFYVDLSNPVNAALGKARGAGTIRDDDHANQSPTVRLTSPENNATFLPGSDIQLMAEAVDPDGTVARVDFFVGGTLIGTATKAPFTVTWPGISVLGEYTLTAKATDDQGAASTSNPVLIKIANVTADVAIVRNGDDPEIAVIQAYLFELGLTYHVFDKDVATFDALKGFQLVIWDDLGKTGLRDRDVDMFQRLFNASIPIYFIGERLASVTSSLSEPYRSQWTRLIHLQPATTTQAGDGSVLIVTDSNHRVINGRFGLVIDFDYPTQLDQTTQNHTSEVVLAQSGAADVVVASEDPNTDVRTVSQNLLVVNSSSSEQSVAERKRLFLNAVWWLLRKPLCGLTDITITQSASANPARTGANLVYTLVVQRSGECQNTGVTVTDTLPPNVKFVTAETPQGTWSEANGVVTFRLGLLEEVYFELKVTVTPTAPGQITNVAKVRGNEREQNVANNSSSLAIQVQGTALGPQATPAQGNGQATTSALVLSARPVLALRLGSPDQLELTLHGELGAAYTIETSADLVHWNVRSRLVVVAPVTTVTDTAHEGARFYRALKSGESTE